MKIGKKLGEGAGSEVFEWEDENKIIKLAKPNTSIVALQREFENCRIAWECGLPVPKPFELITIGERSGIVFERIYGKSLLSRLVDGNMNRPNGQQHSDDFFQARLTARLLYQVHSHSASNLQNQRENIKYAISRTTYLTEDEKTTLIADLNQLPMKQFLCHGDPNPGNILLRERDAIIIDWNDASIGNPEADLAEYVLLLRFAAIPSFLNPSPTMRSVLDSKREESIRIFLEEYAKLSGITYTDIEPWLAPLAARKLAADAFSEAEKASLVTEIRRRIQRK